MLCLYPLLLSLDGLDAFTRLSFTSVQTVRLLANSLTCVCVCTVLSIIDAKREQTNFQLIIITHEADFVEMLGQHIEAGGGPSLGHYFVISREQTCVASRRVFLCCAVLPQFAIFT